MLRVATFLFRAIVLFPSAIILIPAGHPIFHSGFFQYRESLRVQRIAVVFVMLPLPTLAVRVPVFSTSHRNKVPSSLIQHSVSS